jgi:DNA ligase-1
MKPMKPVTVENGDLEKLKFPLYASKKLDGIRCVIVDGEPLSNTLKRIPNEFVYSQLKDISYSLDGELLLENEDAPNQPGLHNFNDVQSAMMNRSGEPKFVLWVFDLHAETVDFSCRNDHIMRIFNQHGNAGCIKRLPQVLCNNLEELMAFEEQALTAGYEGIMLRSLTGTYKFGRSTFKEHYLLRRKPFVTEECRIADFVEKMTNTNEAYKNELGHTKRSSAQEGLVPAGTLGSFIVKNKKWGQFTLGCGKLTHAERKFIWENQNAHLGNIATFKYQSIGSKEAPRILTFQHFRNQADMTAEQLELL